MNSLFAINIIENPALVEAGTPIHIRRSWKKRLFSRPWKPLQATIVKIPMIPIRRIYRLPTGALIMHPEIAKELRQAMSQLITQQPQSPIRPVQIEKTSP